MWERSPCRIFLHSRVETTLKCSNLSSPPSHPLPPIWQTAHFFMAECQQFLKRRTSSKRRRRRSEAVVLPPLLLLLLQKMSSVEFSLASKAGYSWGSVGRWWGWEARADMIIIKEKALGAVGEGEPTQTERANSPGKPGPESPICAWEVC